MVTFGLNFPCKLLLTFIKPEKTLSFDVPCKIIAAVFEAGGRYIYWGGFLINLAAMRKEIHGSILLSVLYPAVSLKQELNQDAAS